MAVLSLTALILSIIMTWHFLAGRPLAGCGGGSPCELVLSSRWSSIAGIVPVSGLAVGTYLAILVAIIFVRPSSDSLLKRLAFSVMLIFSGAVAGSAIWFTYVQKWLIGSFCPYCMTAHTTGLILSVFVFSLALKSRKELNFSPLTVAGRFFAGSSLAGILVLSQLGFSSFKSYDEGELVSNIIAPDYRNAPVIGSYDAPYIVSVLFDYQCSHCQKLHFLLRETVERYNGKLAFILFPAPLSPQCNPFVPAETEEFKYSCELARMGLAVWAGNSKAFAEFEDWMFSFESGDRWVPRSPDAVKIKAEELLGSSVYEQVASDPWITEYLKASTQMYGHTYQDGRGGIPKLIFGSKWVIPESYNLRELLSVLQQSLGVPEP